MTQTQIEQHTAVPTTGILDRLLFGLALGALALAPTQLTVAVKGIPLAPAEILLSLAGVIWLIRWCAVRDTHSLPPHAHCLMIAVIGLGLFAPGDLPGGAGKDLLKTIVKEAAQLVLYLIVGATIFRAVLTTPARMRTAVVVLLATTTLAVLFGAVQMGVLHGRYQPDPAKRAVFEHFTPRAYVTIEAPLQVSSTFGSWNEHGFHPSRTAYTGFLALTLPFALALLASSHNKGLLLWMGVLLVGSAVSVMAGYVLPALLLGLLATGVALGRRMGRGVLLGALGFLLLVALVGGHHRRELLQEPYRLTIAAAESADGQAHLKKFWGEQQAALNLFRYNPLFGVGAGNYQGKINQAYDLLGAITSQRLDPDAQNGYLLAAAGTGAVGLAALLALFGTYLPLARRHAAASPWHAAAAGALVALIAMTLVTNPWVRGTSLVIAFIFAILARNETDTPEQRINQQEDIG